MRARLVSPLFPVALAVLLAGSLVAQATQAPVLTVHSIWGTREFASDLVSPTWTKDGAAYMTIETDSAGHTDLYRVDAVSGKQERLVRGVDLVPAGATQPVAIEEYRFSSDGARLLIFTHSARAWSPDGRRIAFWRLDQTAIRPFYLLNADSLYPELVPVRYPKAGTPNSEVRIGVVDLATHRTAWVDLGPDKDIYVAAMDFAGSGDEIWLTRLNRHQNRLDLLLADTQRGASRVIMTDRDSAWGDANQPRWIDGGKQFLFVSERDGYDQVYLFNRDGSLVRRVTPGGWDVLQVYGVDEKKRGRYCSGAIDGPLGRPLVRIGLDGKGVTRISPEPGTHGVGFDPAFQLYVDTYSRAGVPPVQTLRRAGGTLVRTLAGKTTPAAGGAGLAPPRPPFITS